MTKQVVTAALALLVAGCAGTMQGMMRGSGEKVTIAYQQGMEHDNLEVILPDGERFTGKAVMAGRGTAFGWGFGTAYASGIVGSASASTFSVVETYTGNMRAVLFGDRSRTMRCSLQYADSTGFTTAGGVGVCETSDGQIIDVLW